MCVSQCACMHLPLFILDSVCSTERISIVFVFVTAIRFGRMPQSEKLKLRAKLQIPEKEERQLQLDDWKTLASQIHEAYLKHFHLNKAKARGFLTGKTNMPVSITSTFICTYCYFLIHLHQFVAVTLHHNCAYSYILIRIIQYMCLLAKSAYSFLYTKQQCSRQSF